MKARVKPSKDDIERRNQIIWETICEAQTNSNAIMLIAVAEFFGLGKKRINQLSEFFVQKKKEFDEYDHEGRFKEKLVESLNAIGIDTSELWKFQTFEEVEKEVKRNNQPVISIAEARGIRQHFNGFKHIMEHME